MSASLIAKLCGPSIPAPVFSKGNSMYLRFVTDNALVAKGFKIHYKTGKFKVSYFHVYIRRLTYVFQDCLDIDEKKVLTKLATGAVRPS